MVHLHFLGFHHLKMTFRQAAAEREKDVLWRYGYPDASNRSYEALKSPDEVSAFVLPRKGGSRFAVTCVHEQRSDY